MAKAKVRIVQVYDCNDKERELQTYFVYRGWYAKLGGHTCWHTSRYIRPKSNVWRYSDDDIFTMDHTTFDNPEYFKQVVDEHCEYLIGAHGSLENAFALNR